MPELSRTPSRLIGETAEPPQPIRLRGNDTRRRTLGMAVVMMILAAAVAVSLLTAGEDTATVRAGGPTESAGANTPVPAAPRVELELASGWRTLHADGDRLVVGTRPLAERDLLLALLARDDAVFSAFPPDGAVLVVGGDRLKAKYVGDPSRATRSTTADGAEVVHLGPDAMVGPGPALGLGPPEGLAGGVTVRLGDVPKSSLTLAAYLGPRASAGTAQDVEAMAATVRLLPIDPGAIPPPPPGSRPGFDQGGVQAPDERLRPVASFSAPGVTYSARADADCAVVVTSVSTQPLGGGCRPRPTTPSTAEVVAVAADRGSPPLPPPGQSLAPGTAARWPQAMIVLSRVGPGTGRVTAVLVDGRTTDATVGGEGWALVATDGRVLLLEVRDAKGKLVAEVSVT